MIKSHAWIFSMTGRTDVQNTWGNAEVSSAHCYSQRPRNISAPECPFIAQLPPCFYLNFLIFQTCRYFWTLLDLTEPVFDLLHGPQGAHFIHPSCKLIMLTDEGWNHIKGCAHTSEITWAERLFSYKNWVSASEKAWGKACKTAGDTSHWLPYLLR